ncbi:MAG: hypothetical protein SV686_04535 [Thermodesulfobacteriota bacterium]|nr:hypothetical protein [Thermodesulfobacteriota bacterium]
MINTQVAMIIYDGQYSWTGRKDKHRPHKPVCWWPGSCRLTIADLSKDKPDLLMLKPIIVLAADPQEGYTVGNRYQDLIRTVCREFGLDENKVLWIRYNPAGPDEMQVAVIVPETRVGDEVLYSVTWRDLMPREKTMVLQYLPAGSIGETGEKNSP